MSRDWGPLRARLIHAGYRESVALPLYLGIRLTAAAGLFVGCTALLSRAGWTGTPSCS